jgi:hypothetical protein
MTAGRRWGTVCQATHPVLLGRPREVIVGINVIPAQVVRKAEQATANQTKIAR